MTYTYENAQSIVKSYLYLIDQYSERGSGITDICIVPFDPGQMAEFIEYYQTETSEKALMLAGFIPSEVRIVVVSEQTLTAPSFMLDLDIYLTQKNIIKIYDDKGQVITAEIK